MALRVGNWVGAEVGAADVGTWVNAGGASVATDVEFRVGVGVEGVAVGGAGGVGSKVGDGAD